jgi:Sodium/hydrogen exchanger family
LIGGGVFVGLAIGGVIALFEKWVDDGPIEIVISILLPYATYLISDRVHASGVIAVIACGMYMSRKSPEYMSPQVRLQMTAVWDALTFVLNGIVFVMIGLQLPYVRGLRRSGTENRVKDFHEFVSSGLRSGRNSPLATASGIENEYRPSILIFSCCNGDRR